MKSDLHPFECGKNCMHCRQAVEGGHIPFLCAFCTPGLDNGALPIERQLVSRLTEGPFQAVDPSNPLNVRAAEIANALYNSGVLGRVKERQ